LAPLAGVARTLERLRLPPTDAAEQRQLTERPGPAAGPDAPAAGAGAPTVAFGAFEALLGARLAASGRDVLALVAEVPATCFSAVAKARDPPAPPAPAPRAAQVDGPPCGLTVRANWIHLPPPLPLYYLDTSRPSPRTKRTR
jgi:hypothetical protein